MKTMKNMKQSRFILFVLVFLMAGTWNVYAQNITVTGIVLDGTGEPVIGANVKVVGTLSVGTITDYDGKFSLAVSGDAKKLEVSYIGMKSQEVTIQSGSQMKIVLKEDTEQLDEVVVIGYGTVKKRDLTGSVASIKQKDIVAIPSTNVLETLQGKVAGMDMIKTSGQVGAGISYSIRGNRSLNASNAPLILVDGVPYGSDIDINPEAIESIDILKDASSTAIYGSRGANGVILITTKQGENARTKVSYSGYFSFDSMWGYPDLMNTGEYADFLREANRASGKWSGPEDDYKIFMSAYDYIKNDVNVDWIDLVTRNGYSTSHAVNLSSGGEKTKFNASFQYLNQKGILYNDDMDRFSGTLSLTHNISNKLTFDVSTIFAYTDLNRGQDPFNMAIKYGPYGKPYNDDGSINMHPYPEISTISPMAEIVDGNYENNTKTYRIFASGGLTWTPIQDLFLKTSFNANITNAREGRYWGSTTHECADGYSKASARNKQGNSLVWENTVNYAFDINESHQFTILVGSELTKTVNEMYYAEGRDILSPAMLFHNLESAQKQQQIESQYTKSTMASFFGRINYKFGERYLLTATMRYDGSSVLAPGHKWALFPSVAAAWRVNEENFMAETKDWLDNLKLRVSYGISGNSAVDAYQTGGGLGTTMYVFDVNGNEEPQYGYWPQAISNHDLSWEKTATIDVGLDLGMFNNRINLSVDWYLQKTKNLLMQKQIPVTNGYLSSWANVGKTKNTGIEIVLNTRNIIKKNFTWNTDLTFTRNKEEIVELADGNERDIANGWFVGQPTEVHYALDKLGIWQTGEAEEAAKYGYKPGQVKNRDADKSGAIDAEDRVIIGTTRPDFVVGMNNTFKIHDFDFSFFLYWRHGNMLELSNYWGIGATQRCFSYIDYWSPENPTNDYPRPDNSFSGSDISLSGLNYYDASFLKIRDITLGYTLPEKWTRSVGMGDVRLYCTMKNFFEFDNLPCSGYDAERMGGYGYPTIKQLVLGLNVNF